MKLRKILYTMAILFVCSITMSVKAGTVVVGIEEDGSLTRMHDPAFNDRYTYEDGVLTLSKVDDSDAFVLNYAKSDLTIKTTTDITFYSFTVVQNANVTLESTNNVNLGNPTINGTFNINNSKNITISSIVGSGNTNINNSEVSIGVIGGTAFTSNNSTLNMTQSIGHTPKSYSFVDTTMNGTGVWLQSGGEKNYITNSKINLETLYFVTGPVYIDNSELNIGDTISSSMPFDMRNTKLYYGNYFQLTNADTYIENSDITSGESGNRKQMLISSTNFHIKDSTMDMYGMQLNCSGDSIIENTKIKLANADVLFVNNMTDSELTVTDNGFSTEFENVKNSKIKFKGNSTVQINNVENSDISLELSSTLLFNNSNIINSNINVKISATISGSIDEINRSEMIIDGSSGVLFASRLGNIIKSHIIIQNDVADAVFGYEDIFSTNDIFALDEDGNLLTYAKDDSYNYDVYRFYKNGVEAKYVEIRSGLDVKVHVVNGTWEDGTTDDKVIKSYAGIKMSDIDLPTNMKANDGYENGKWSVTISDDKIYDDIELTYTFVEKGKSAEEAIESDDLTNPKTGDNIIILVITMAISVIGLILFRNKMKACK